MSIMVNLPPTMEKDVASYVTFEGTSIEEKLIAYLKEEIARSQARRQEGRRLMDQWRATVRKSRGRLAAPYEFNRADAYEESAGV